MFDFLFLSAKKRKALEKLEKELIMFHKPTLQNTAKQKLKQQLLTSLKNNQQAEILPRSFKNLVAAIKQEGNKVHLHPLATVSLKERLLDTIESYRQRVLPIPYLKTILTAALLFVFVVTTFFAFPLLPVPTSYARSTYISDVEGNVFISRGQEILRAMPFSRLQEGDTILTRQHSFATVTFFDDSQSRLSENTQLQIQKLQFLPFNHVASQVELFLQQGRMWGKVVNLVDDDSHFIVQTNNATATVLKKASFDLSEEGNSTKMRVYDNVVDLHYSQKENKTPLKTVVAGYQAEISNNNDIIQLQPVNSTTFSSTGDDMDWISSNLQEDDAYYQTILQNKKELFESDDINDGFQNNSSEYGENIPLFTNPQIESTKAHFFEAYLDLKKGENLLADGSHKEGLHLLGQFHRALKDFVIQYPELQKMNPEEAKTLQQIIDEKVALQLKDLAAFMPGDRLYVAKEILQQAELSLADSEVEKAKIRLSQADGKLFEIQYLIKKGQLDLAHTMLKNYSDQMSQFVLKIGPENYKEVEANLISFVEKQMQQLKILIALEQSLSQQPDSSFKDEIRSIRRDQLKKLMGSLDELSVSVPKELLSQLRDIFDSYLHDSADDEDLIIPLFNRLVDGQYQLLFLQPQQVPVPTDIGIVTIITEVNPTADVQETQQTPLAPETQPLPSITQDQLQPTQETQLNEAIQPPLSPTSIQDQTQENQLSKDTQSSLLTPNRPQTSQETQLSVETQPLSLLSQDQLQVVIPTQDNSPQSNTFDSQQTQN